MRRWVGAFAGWLVVVTVATLVYGASISSLSDNFNDNSRDTAKWNVGTLGRTQNASVTVNETSQQLQITTLTGLSGEHYNGYVSVDTFDLTGSSASVEVVQATGGASANTEFSVGIDASNWVRINKQDTAIYFERQNAGAYSSVFSTTYSATTHRWWRIRHETSNDTWRWDTSLNGVDWTQQTTEARGHTITAVRATIMAGTWASMATAQTAMYDNFNTTGAVSGILFHRRRRP
jgi:hypothetical protein